MSTKKNQCDRKQVWVQDDVQGNVLWRVMTYWSACFLFVTLPLVWSATWQDPSKMMFHHVSLIWAEYWPIYLGLFVLLPITIWDALRFSHRIAGPLSRVKRQLTAISKGEPFSELKFRGDDFWQEMIDLVNQVGRKTLS